MFFSRYFFLVISQIIILLGCSAANLQEFSLETPAQILNPVGMPSVYDGRARFREIFCKLLSEAPEYQDKAEHCENYLTRLSDERIPAEQLRPLPSNNINLRILVVPGLLGECIADTAFPFEKAMERLRPLGYQIEPLIVSGRSSSDYNAKKIAKAVANLAVGEEDFLILIGHSKGANDILHFLVNFPSLAHRVDAVVSVAGAINGSPIANQVDDIYSKLGANLPFNECEPGDGGAFRSLKRSTQFPWMTANPLPQNVQYYSTVAFTNRKNVQAGLLLTYDLLRNTGPRNDGQVIFYDQVIPGVSLLGYINLDHWAIAVPVKEKTASSAWKAAATHPHVRALLFEAMILFIVEKLSFG